MFGFTYALSYQNKYILRDFHLRPRRLGKLQRNNIVHEELSEQWNEDPGYLSLRTIHKIKFNPLGDGLAGSISSGFFMWLQKPNWHWQWISMSRWINVPLYFITKLFKYSDILKIPIVSNLSKDLRVESGSNNLGVSNSILIRESWKYKSTNYISE